MGRLWSFSPLLLLREGQQILVTGPLHFDNPQYWFHRPQMKALRS
jgi:hypothetical protein